MPTTPATEDIVAYNGSLTDYHGMIFRVIGLTQSDYDMRMVGTYDRLVLRGIGRNNGEVLRNVRPTSVTLVKKATVAQRLIGYDRW